MRSDAVSLRECFQSFRSFEKSGTNRLTTQRRISEEPNPPQQYENLKILIIN